MKYGITLIRGDGIGPEVTEAAKDILDASGTGFDWHIFDAGEAMIKEYGTPLSPAVIESIRKDTIALKGPIATPIGSGFRSVNVALRKELSLYANYRPTHSVKGIRTRFDDVDLIVIRENTEGLYSGLEHTVTEGVVESLRVITEKGSERIVRFAFETAKKYNRNKVTAVHKANILKLSDGLFLDVARRVAGNYPEIEYEESIIDATAMKLVMDPGKYDVLVMENLFGDIISDLTSGLVGGLGVAPSANIGDTCAVFEAVHGSAPDIAGKGIANPTALIFSSVLLLRYLGENNAADRVYNAVAAVISTGKHLPVDLGGSATTGNFVKEIITNMQ